VSARCITLLTDFGTRDGYVAAMKGVITDLCHETIIQDASHDIAPGDVTGAAFALRRYWRIYPRETMHIVVVDPGVGSARRALAVRADDRFLVGPDNGVLSLALRDAESWKAVAITNREMILPNPSSTFHGRDVFAPAAARLACGRALSTFGDPVEDIVQLNAPKPRAELNYVEGEVVYIDRFGNLVTNMPAATLPPKANVTLDGKAIGLVRSTYAEVKPGEAVAVINSDMVLEIGVRDGNAASILAVAQGTKVRAGN